VTPAPLAFEEAERIVLAAVPRLEAEEVDLDQSLGRVLAYDVRLGCRHASFDKAAMDGLLAASRMLKVRWRWSQRSLPEPGPASASPMASARVS